MVLVADNFLAFKKIDCLPPNMAPRLKEDQDNEEILRSHKAKWHDNCRLIQFNKTNCQRAVKRKAFPAESVASPLKTFTCRRLVQTSTEPQQCFFCGKPANDSDSLHRTSTFDLDIRVRQCAQQLQDQTLLAKLSEGDLIALEAKYHAQCLALLYNRARQTMQSYEQVARDMLAWTCELNPFERQDS